jgi:hypothetical protein
MVFQYGDVPILIDGTRYFLRLTLGALAEIDARLGVKGPSELAHYLRQMTADHASAQDAFTLLECLLRSSPPPDATDISAVVLMADPDIFLPMIADVFEMSFKEKL